MRIWISLILVVCFFASCEKQDKSITLPPKGDGTLMQLDMGENYTYQYYINFDEEKIVHISEINTWHLAFQSGNDQQGVFVNSGIGMAVYPTGKSDFASVHATDTAKALRNWKYDAPYNDIDSSGIGNWAIQNQVYIVKLDKSNNNLRKLKIVSADAFEYKIEIGDIESGIPASFTVIKNKDQNQTYFSFFTLAEVPDVEPPAGKNWDCVFTTYNYTFYEQQPALPYVVNGALCNYAVKGSVDSVLGYAQIDKTAALQMNLVEKKDIIGFNWKTYNVDQNLYTIKNNYTYIIQNRFGRLYKIRFLDFYSSNGVKGSPKFEYKLL